MSHTRGSWAVKGETICEVCPVLDNGQLDTPIAYDIRGLEDARLIAAAPDILSALRVMVGVYRELASRVGAIDGQAQVSEALAVIAKAEGR
jgi:hypothetical protein